MYKLSPFKNILDNFLHKHHSGFLNFKYILESGFSLVDKVFYEDGKEILNIKGIEMHDIPHHNVLSAIIIATYFNLPLIDLKMRFSIFLHL